MNIYLFILVFRFEYMFCISLEGTYFEIVIDSLSFVFIQNVVYSLNKYTVYIYRWVEKNIC